MLLSSRLLIELDMRICEIDGCDLPHSSKNMCKKHYMEEYRKNNKDRINKNYSNWVAANPDKKLAARKRYNSSAKAISYRQNYNQAHRSEQTAYSTKRYWLQREHIKVINKRWRAVNSEKLRNNNMKRKARLNGVAHEFYTVEQVLDLYGTRCHLCGFKIDLTVERQVGKDGWYMSLHIDHVIPISKDGPDTLANVRPAHGYCNVSKHNRI